MKAKKPKKLENITITETDKLNLISNLGTMITAGISILSAVHSLSEEARGNVKIILEEIYADLLRGQQLHTTLAKFPRVFDKITINMVKAAEQSGTLDIILKDLKDQIKKDIAFSRKLKSAAVYPVIVLLIFLGVLIMILTVVIPKISTVFTQLKINIPLPTRVLIFASNAVLHQTLYVIGGISLSTAAILLIYKYQQRRIHNFLHRLPVISKLVKEIDLFRFTRNMHLMLSSGINIVTALELTIDIVRKKEIAVAITEMKSAVYAGQTLSSCLKQKRKIFPGTMIELTQAGEVTGSLDSSMHSISEYFDNQVSDTLHVLITLLEPILLVIVAVLVGAMMVAIIGPIYNMIGQIGEAH